MTEVRPDKTLDVRGQMCPVPVIRTGRAISEVPIGGILEVLATDPGSLADVPAWAKSRGHEVLAVQRVWR